MDTDRVGDVGTEDLEKEAKARFLHCPDAVSPECVYNFAKGTTLFGNSGVRDRVLVKDGDLPPVGTGSKKKTITYGANVATFPESLWILRICGREFPIFAQPSTTQAERT
jgi:hypothetical protein